MKAIGSYLFFVSLFFKNLIIFLSWNLTFILNYLLYLCPYSSSLLLVLWYSFAASKRQWEIRVNCMSSAGTMPGCESCYGWVSLLSYLPFLCFRIITCKMETNIIVSVTWDYIEKDYRIVPTTKQFHKSKNMFADNIDYLWAVVSMNSGSISFFLISVAFGLSQFLVHPERGIEHIYIIHIYIIYLNIFSKYLLFGTGNKII